MARTARLTDAIRGSRKALLVAGSVAALVGVGAGTASAATAASPAAPASHDRATRIAGRQAARRSSRPGRRSWDEIAEIQAHRADPSLGGGPLPAADQLRPVASYGPQQYMSLDSAQVGNAATIVKQALGKKMGVRSAVVAVATAMQESTLKNINYGTSDSVGLFQQRPSCGWGTAQQIMDPAYASDAFLSALQRYQAANPDWASQPLYQTAQGVQASGFPTAYAQWEDQAASLVQGITMHLSR